MKGFKNGADRISSVMSMVRRMDEFDCKLQEMKED